MRKCCLRFFITILFSCLSTALFAQVYDEPTFKKWRQIKTEHFKIVYPPAIDSMAQHYANVLEKAYNPVSRSLNNYYKGTIPLVLHPADLQSNAWVKFAPREMHFKTAPLLGLSTTTWAKMLSLHEFRHYVQISKYNTTGILKPLSWLCGDLASSVWGYFVPSWFFEGDAVLSETAMSLSGRGRMPSFFAGYRAYLLSGVDFSHDKWMNGSYRDFIPNIYSFGYIQTSYARKKYGEDIWEKTLYNTQTKSFPLFRHAFKSTSKQSLENLQKEAFAYLKDTWEKENRGEEENVKYLTEDSKHYTSYVHPIAIDSEKIIAVKSDLKRLSSLVLFNNGKEEHLVDLGYIYDKICYKSNKVYWLEDIRDTRWAANSSNAIFSFDLGTKKIKKCVSGTRYRLLAFAEDADNFIASKLSEEGNNFISIIDAKSFVEISAVPTLENGSVLSLALDDDGKNIAAALLSDKGVSLNVFNLETARWSTIIPSSSINIDDIHFYNDHIVFDSGFDGVDNIYAVSLISKNIKRLSNSKFGAMTADIHDNTLVYSGYYSNGIKIATKEIDLEKQDIVDWDKPYTFELAEIMAKQERFIIDTVDFSNAKTYETTNYSKLNNLVRVRNWRPFYSGLELPGLLMHNEANDLNRNDRSVASLNKPSPIGFTVMSQDLLSSTSMILGGSWDIGSKSPALHAGITCRAFYPVFSIQAHYGGDKNLMVNDTEIFSGDENFYSVSASSHIPFNFSNARYQRNLIPAATITIDNTRFYSPITDVWDKKNRVEYSLTGLIFKRKARADIFPKWGVIADIRYLNAPFNESFGRFYGGRLSVYTPGVAVNHGLRLSLTYQKQDKGVYSLNPIYAFPRETYRFPCSEMHMFSADYSLPLMYPDGGLRGLLYINRVRANVFGDFAVISHKNGIRDVYSIGTDIFFDFFVLRNTLPMSLGVRIATTERDDLRFRFLFGLNF